MALNLSTPRRTQLASRYIETALSYEKAILRTLGAQKDEADAKRYFHEAERLLRDELSREVEA